MHVVNKTIVEALRRPGWNQKRLADALGSRPQTVNKWVKGENTPPLKRWAEIETALELPGALFAAAGLAPVGGATVEPSGDQQDYNSRAARLTPEDRAIVDALFERLLGDDE